MKKSNQKGFSAIIVLLMIILLVLVGFIGWYVWDKQHNKQTSQSQSLNRDNNSQKPSQSAVQSKPVENKNLVINEWGIEIPISVDYSYVLGETVDNIKITSKTLTEAENKINCHEGNGFRVYRAKNFESGYPAKLSPNVNGYQYALQHSNQGLCIDSQGVAPKEVNDIYDSEYKQLEQAWPNIKSTN